MKGFEIIRSLINYELRDGTIQSYLYEGELQDLVFKTYLKFDSKWVEIVVTDDVTMVRLCDENVANFKQYGDSEYKYTTEKFHLVFPEFQKYIAQKLLSFKKIVSVNDEELSFGISLYFTNNLVLTIFNHDYPIDKNEIVFGRIKKQGYKEI